MDQVFVKGLEVEAIVGVHGWEQRVARPLVLDLELGVDARHAASSDALRDAVDYSAVAVAVRDTVTAAPAALLETLAERVARMLFQRFPIQSLRLALTKPGAIPDVAAVGVRIERRREDYASCGQ